MPKIPTKQLRYQKKYDLLHKDKKKEYYQSKKETLKAYQKNYYVNHKEKVIESIKIYRKAMFIVVKNHPKEFKQVIKKLKEEKCIVGSKTASVHI